MTKRNKIVFCLVLLFLFAVHAAVSVWTLKAHYYFFMHNDGGAYFDLARTLCEDGVYGVPGRIYYEAPRDVLVPDAFRLPMLPFLTVPFFAVFGATPVIPALMQAFFATALSALMFFAVKRFTDGDLRASWTALALVNAHPVIFMFSAQYSTELLFMVFLALFLLLTFLRESVWKYVFLAASLAGAAYTRSAILPALPVCCLAFVFFQGADAPPFSSWRRFVKPVVFGAVFSFLLLPWCVRNKLLFDRFTPGTALGGFNLFIGNSRENLAAYRSGAGFMKEQRKVWLRAEKIAGDAPPEFVRRPFLLDARYVELAKRGLMEMGLYDAFALQCYKAWHFIRPWTTPGCHSPLLFYGFAFFETVFFLTAFSGLWLARRKWRLLAPFAALFLAGWITHVIVQAHLRYRVPFVDLLLIVPASVAFSHFVRLVRRKWKGRGRGNAEGN